MNDKSDYLYRVVRYDEFEEKRLRERGFDYSPTIYGPYSLLGTAKATKSRESRNVQRYRLHPKAVSFTIQRTKIDWEDVEA